MKDKQIKSNRKPPQKVQFKVTNNKNRYSNKYSDDKVSSDEEFIKEDETDHSDDSELEENILEEEESSKKEDFYLADNSDDEILKKKSVESNEEGSDDEWLNADIQHKKSLENLKKIDPEFYQFLEENDKKLLDFDASDESDIENEEKYHKPSAELELGSEESDYEAEEGVKASDKSVTLAFVKTCREKLINDPCVGNIRLAVELFHAALDRVTGEDTSPFTVDGSAVFNAVMEMCVMHLHKAIVEFLKLPAQHAKDPSKSKKWVKIKSLLQGYFTDLFKILEGVASEHIISVLLKHLHALCCYVACFQKLSKAAIKHLTKLWSTGEESVRVLAFLCILRLSTVVPKSVLLNAALKLMYIAYIRGAKFVSANTLPQINFMKQTLVTLLTINSSLSYQHSFLYIRQLAIHLRNAITIQKKETFQSVYNWQYINSLRLWVDLMCASQQSSELQQLLYPLIQIILGCIRLIPTAQYLPLRFHCIQMLIKIGNEIGAYTPVLPFILEAISCADLNKRLKKASMKPFDFTFVLRLSKAAMTETGFTDAVVENVFELLLETCTSNSHSIAFPDLVVPTIVQLKSIIKECKTPKYSSKLKQALLKIEENYNYLNNERNKININLREIDKIKAFEVDIKAKGTPLQKYLDQYKKSQNLVKAKRVADENARLCDMGFPKIKRPKLTNKEIKKENEGPVELFPSDESDLEIPEHIGSTNEKKDKKKKKKITKPLVNVDIKSEDEMLENEVDDLVEELNIDTF
ncbi:nucleolar complex protein 2 [Rhodnius prolixus]|uniref:nucleolar complex protein 2 n=1 Tax=Rhodnius prolixus TaxID=13249 RepID=UPI003D18A98F